MSSSSQLSKMTILQSWKAGTVEKIDISKELNHLFKYSEESITLESSFWFDDASSGDEVDSHCCNYHVSLRFNSDVWVDRRRNEYEIRFYVILKGGNFTTGLKFLCGCKVIRSSDDDVQFKGGFITKHRFLKKCDKELSYEYQLYCQIRKSVRNLESDMEPQLGSSSSAQDDSSDEWSDVSSNNDKSDHEQIDEVTDFVIDLVREIDDELTGVKTLKENLRDAAEQQLSEFEVKLNELEATERNLMLQLQETEQLAQSEIQELQGKVKQLEMSADGQKRKFEIQINELEATERNLMSQLQEAEQQAQIEIQELQSQVKQLELSVASQARQLEKRTEELEDQLKCSVCYENPVDVVLIPCGHAKFCQNCVRNSGCDQCMYCRQVIDRSYKLIL